MLVKILSKALLKQFMLVKLVIKIIKVKLVIMRAGLIPSAYHLLYSIISPIPGVLLDVSTLPLNLRRQF